MNLCDYSLEEFKEFLYTFRETYHIIEETSVDGNTLILTYPDKEFVRCKISTTQHEFMQSFYRRNSSRILSEDIKNSVYFRNIRIKKINELL